jgi:glycosyltransferase involved in cell wall biosynthesis
MGLSRLKGVGIWVDPRDVKEIEKAILYLADDSNYFIEKQKVENFSFINTWRDICIGFLKVFENLK